MLHKGNLAIHCDLQLLLFFELRTFFDDSMLKNQLNFYFKLQKKKKKIYFGF